MAINIQAQDFKSGVLTNAVTHSSKETLIWSIDHKIFEFKKKKNLENQ